MSKPILKRNASMLSGLTMEEMDPIVPKKSPKIEPDTKHQSGDSSELFGQDIEDIDCGADQLESKDEEKSKESHEDETSFAKSFLKGFTFKNCTVNFQLPGNSPK